MVFQLQVLLKLQVIIKRNEESFKVQSILSSFDFHWILLHQLQAIAKFRPILSA